MARSKLFTYSALAVAIALVLPLIGAQKPAANSSLTSLTVVLPKDEDACETMGFRDISGEFELAKPVESVDVVVEVYDDGAKSDPFPRGAQHPGDERRGRFRVLFVDLENMNTVRNSNDLPLRLAPHRGYFKYSLLMGKRKGGSGAGPIDADRFIDLHGPVQYHVFTAGDVTNAEAPMFAMYAGKAPLDAEGVASVADLLKRNPKGRLVIVSLRLNGIPGANHPLQAK